MPRAVAFATGLLLAACCLLAADREAPLVVSGENAFGQVWVNLALAGLRLDEAYLPMVVAVYNRAGGHATLTRDSFRLIGMGGQEGRVPGVKEFRQAYRSAILDRRMVSTWGIPLGTRIRRGRTVPSNFFPGMGSTGGGIAVDRVNLPPLYGMVDLLYFERPRGLALGQPVVLEVGPAGWEEPIRVRFRVMP